MKNICMTKNDLNATSSCFVSRRQMERIVISVSGSDSSAAHHYPQLSQWDLWRQCWSLWNVVTCIAVFACMCLSALSHCHLYFCLCFVYRTKIQPGCQFLEATPQPQMYCQAALWGYVSYMFSMNQFPVKWIRNRHLNGSHSAKFPTERTSHLWSACWRFSPSLVFMSCPYLLGVLLRTGGH